MTDQIHDELVPDRQVAQELNVTAITLWRWDHDPAKVAEGWPPPVRQGSRKFRSRKLLEQYKNELIERAIAARQHSLASASAIARGAISADQRKFLEREATGA